MEIKSAVYGCTGFWADVTERVRGLVAGKRHLSFYVSNGVLGDPAPYRKKQIRIKYMDGSIEREARVDENTLAFLPEPKHDNLGIYYTNNDLEPWVLDSTVQQLAKADNVDIFTCPWRPIPGNPFVERIFPYNQSQHLSICLQILTLLSLARAVKRYTRVFFLEHDVLYPADYFHMPEIPEPLMVNDQYIGMNASGYQLTKADHEPLHQMVMDHDFALTHFHTLLDRYLRGDGMNLEPEQKRVRRHTARPAIHINHGRHLTSHYDIYCKDTVPSIPYWGDHAQWWGKTTAHRNSP